MYVHKILNVGISITICIHKPMYISVYMLCACMPLYRIIYIFPKNLRLDNCSFRTNI